MTITSFGYLVKNQLRFGYYLREHIHSHPSGNDWISSADSTTVKELPIQMGNPNIRFFLHPIKKDTLLYYEYDRTTTPRVKLKQ